MFNTKQIFLLITSQGSGKIQTFKQYFIILRILTQGLLDRGSKPWYDK